MLGICSTVLKRIMADRTPIEVLEGQREVEDVTVGAVSCPTTTCDAYRPPAHVNFRAALHQCTSRALAHPPYCFTASG